MLTRGLKWRVRLVAYAPLFVWIGVIFYLSSPQGAMSETSRFIRPLLQFLFPTAPEETLQVYHAYVRKAAHFSEYAVLAYLAVRSFAASALPLFCKYRFILALVLVALVASVDELNQSFEAERTGSVIDILLDISGGVVMLAALYLIKRPRPVRPIRPEK